MKRKNREINIFSMSALDLFASAMGAFLLIAVMALPYYLKVSKNMSISVTLEWKKNNDMDLHIYSPSKKHYSYGNKKYNGSNSRLIIDKKNGPGYEIWFAPDAEIGTYKIKVDNYTINSGGSKNVKILLKIFYDGNDGSDGIKEIRKVITYTGNHDEPIPVAEVELSKQGVIRLDTY